MAHWPQYTVIGLWALSVLVHGINQGEPIKGKWNPWWRLVGVFINATLLYFGGFFAPIGFAP